MIIRAMLGVFELYNMGRGVILILIIMEMQKISFFEKRSKS